VQQENGLTNLFDMQCMWYELEYGSSCMRQGDIGLALKKFLDIKKVLTTLAAAAAAAAAAAVHAILIHLIE
jgi:hypothetical protein